MPQRECAKYPFSYAQYFILEFIMRMRRNPECVPKPSPRQGIAMGKMLLPAYLRKGYLTFENLLNIAIVTSNIDCQRLAEKHAVEILVEVELKEQKPIETVSGEDFMSFLENKLSAEMYINSLGNES